MRATDIPQFASMGKPEKILLVEDLWDSIAIDDADVPVPQSHKAELDRRSAMPGRLLTLAQLQARVDSRK